MMYYGYILLNCCWISWCSNIFVKWNTTGMVVAFDVLTFGAFVRLFVLASFLVMAALMARSVVPRFLKLMMHLSSQVANDSTALYDSGWEVLPWNLQILIDLREPMNFQKCSLCLILKYSWIIWIICITKKWMLMIFLFYLCTSDSCECSMC